MLAANAEAVDFQVVRPDRLTRTPESPSRSPDKKNAYMKKNLALMSVTSLLPLLQPLYAVELFEEGFNYPTGPLSGNGTWIGGSTGLTVGSANLTYSTLADAANPGNDLVVTSGGTAGSMTINFAGTSITNGSVYYSFLAECTTLPTGNNYLTSMLPVGAAGPNGSSDPLAVYVGQQTAGSTFKIGVRHQGVGSGATYTSNAQLTLNTVNFFVVKYTFGSGGAVSLFVNPTPGATEPTPDVAIAAGGTEAANLQTLGFKAQSSTAAGNWLFDTLRVGTLWADVTPSVPEPQSLSLLSGLVLVAWKLGQRRR
jgi:hypothetical protein